LRGKQQSSFPVQTAQHSSHHLLEFNRSYESVYVQRSGGRRDGCATFWRAGRLHATHVRRIKFHEYDLSDNVALLVALRPVAGLTGDDAASGAGLTGDDAAAGAGLTDDELTELKESDGGEAGDGGASSRAQRRRRQRQRRSVGGGGGGAAVSADDLEDVGLLVANTHVSP
jgi:hypothetical protein